MTTSNILRPADTSQDEAGPGAFPSDFQWGVATSAYQIEGATAEDGRGPSIWDTFERAPGRIRDGATGHVAADHYHRYAEDVGLMTDLGVRAYRFSVSWPRVQPAGRGAVEPRGLAFYDRLVDLLLARGITPWATLHHWDLPQPLQDEGGWVARDTARRFADYALAVYEALHDRVPYWLTLNEPWCVAFLGHASGEHAPGVRNRQSAVRVVHHLLLGHGLAIRAMRAHDPANQRGVTLNLIPALPATDLPEDVDAARRVDGLQNRLFLDPLLLGRYPADVLDDLSRVCDMSHIRDGDLATIAAPIDMLGFNYYTCHTVSMTEGDAQDPSPWVGSEDVRFADRGLPVTSTGWEVDGAGLYDLLLRLHHAYPRLPLAVTENGAAYDDHPASDGDVHDPERVRYLDEHLRAVRRALTAGVDLRAFFVWSLLDNFEWAEGYSKRFGLVYVDYETLRRTPKDSARWYRDVIAAGRLP